MPKINFDPSELDDLDLINVEVRKGPLKKKMKKQSSTERNGLKKKKTINSNRKPKREFVEER